MSLSSLLLSTTDGGFRDVRKQAAKFSPASINPILAASPNLTIASTSIRPNGAPVIQLSDGVTHSYDPALLTWTKLSEPWWAEGSDAWQGRQRTNNQSAARGPVTIIEGAISERMAVDSARAEKVRPAWWSAALTLGHLESKLHAAKALDSPQEYKQALLLYAKRIADEGFRAKAEELAKELFGPVYWCVYRGMKRWPHSLIYIFLTSGDQTATSRGLRPRWACRSATSSKRFSTSSVRPAACT